MTETRLLFRWGVNLGYGEWRPGVWLCPVLQEPQRLRHWFAGTPYGQVDIVPVEADDQCLAGYRLLVFPGWNTMTDGDLERLCRYVQNGGTLVLGLPHLQTSVDRAAVLSRGAFAFPAAEMDGAHVLSRSTPHLAFHGPPLLCRTPFRPSTPRLHHSVGRE
jgi:hypothetical protein